MRHALPLATALGAVLATTAFYANNVRAPIDARGPIASNGSITLAADPAAAQQTARRIVQAAIVWTSKREVS